MMELLMAVSTRLSDTGRWVTEKNLPTALRATAVATIGDAIYYYGGTSSAGSYQRIFTSYNITTGNYEQLQAYPAGRANAFATSVGDNFYLLGGSLQNSVVDRVLWEYNTTTKNWAGRPQVPGTGTLTGLVTAGGYVYATTFNTTSRYTELYRWNPINPTAGWLQLDDHPVTNMYNGLIECVDDRIYYIGGRMGGVFSDQVFYFNTITSQWFNTSPLPEVMGTLQSTVVNGSLYLVNPVNLDTGMAIYKLVNDAYVVQPQEVALRYTIDARATDYGNRLYYIGGLTYVDGVAGISDQNVYYITE